MPDLILQLYWFCETAHCWAIEVKSSSGKTYTVRYDKIHHKTREVQYDYSCDCESYKFGKGKYCKHILAVKDQHCNWHQFNDGGEPVEVNGQKVCPQCGKSVSSERWGV